MCRVMLAVPAIHTQQKPDGYGRGLSGIIQSTVPLVHSQVSNRCIQTCVQSMQKSNGDINRKRFYIIQFILQLFLIGLDCDVVLC